MRLPGVEPGSIAWKAIILTVGLQTLDMFSKFQCIINMRLCYNMKVKCNDSLIYLVF